MVILGLGAENVISFPSNGRGTLGNRHCDPQGEAISQGKCI